MQDGGDVPEHSGSGAELTLDGAPQSARSARGFVHEQIRQLTDAGRLGPLVRADFSDDAVLVVSELVTNAVRADAQKITVRLSALEPSVQISVSDDGYGWPTLNDPAPTDTHGRGLHIVGALAAHWGITDPSANRTTVWAQLDPTPVLGQTGAGRAITSAAIVTNDPATVGYVDSTPLGAHRPEPGSTPLPDLPA